MSSWLFTNIWRIKMPRIYANFLLITTYLLTLNAPCYGSANCYDDSIRVLCECEHHGKNFTEDGIEYKYIHQDSSRVVIAGYKYSAGFAPDTLFHVPTSVMHNGRMCRVERIGNHAFSGLLSVKSIVIEDSISHIGNEAFSYCPNLRSVYIPASVESVGEGIFGNCDNLREIVVDNRNKCYDSRDNCNAVIHTDDNILQAACPVTKIPSSVKAIGNMAFYRQGTLEDIVIPEGVESIGRWAFSGCSNLKHISLPQSLRSMDHSVFENCNSLRSLRIPKNVNHINHYSLAHCYRLTSVVVEEGNSVYDSRDNCNAIIRTADSTLIGGCSTSIIADGVRKILFGSFEGTPIHSIHIPKSVTEIDDLVFNRCNEIESITVDEDNPVYSSPEGSNAILTKDGKTLLLGCRNTEIPAGVEIIGQDAFMGRVDRMRLHLPEGIKEIRMSAFSNDDCLEEVIIPRSVERISDDAFYGCSKLTYVKILAPLAGTKKQTFRDCPKLYLVDFAEGTKKICKGTFQNCPSLNYVFIPSSAEVEEEAFINCPLVKIERK